MRYVALKSGQAVVNSGLLKLSSGVEIELGQADALELGALGFIDLDMKANRPLNPSDSRPACACVITCHNYARYLRECLDSCLAQSWPFEYILVIDDASDDDTPQVCRDYVDREVRYLRTDFRDVAQARQAGIDQLPRTPFILFVDADNRLPVDYRERLQGALLADPHAGVAYGNLRYIGEHDGHLSQYIKPFDYWELRRNNFADACAVIRREAWEQSGGFIHNNYGLQDWALWLTITRLGWGMLYIPQAELQYRMHPQRMSKRREGVYESGVEVMRDAMLTVIVTLFSGRRWALEMYARWLDRLEWRKDNLHLVAIDNSRDADFTAELCAMLDARGISFSLIADDGQIAPEATASEVADTARLRMQHCIDMNVHLSRLYAKARAYMPAKADLVWTVEDDVEPDPQALWNLCLTLFKRPQAGMIVGCLRSRFEPGRLIAWRSIGAGGPNDSGYLSIPPSPGQVRTLEATGFFCSLFPRPVWEAIVFRPGDSSMQHPYYDWAAAADVKRLGREILITGDVRCGHWSADGSCLKP